MGVSRFNSEGYYDPVPHEALSHIEKEARVWKPLVYVASPFAGDEARNTGNAIRYCRFAVDSGAIPLAPHLFLPRFMSEATERDEAMFMNTADSLFQSISLESSAFSIAFASKIPSLAMIS